MKKILSLAMSAAIVFGLASCSKEIDNGLNGGTDGDAAIQFSVKTNKGGLVTYAIAEGAEWDINTIDVYAFANGNLIGKLVKGTDFKEQTSAGVSTITVESTWLTANAGKTVNFYFVGNDASSTGGAHMPAVIPATETAFVELMTNTLPDTDVNGYYDNIETPLLFSAAAKGVALVGKIQKEVSLKRREARFDIVNELYEAFQINDIKISNAYVQGYMFGDATESATRATGSYEAIGGPTVTDYAFENNEYIAKSVFYIYPTVIGEGKTEIIINATMGGVTDNYRVKTAANIEIDANKRYKLIFDPLTLVFTVVAADYDEGGDLETERGSDNAIGLGTFSVPNAANWSEASQVYKIDDAAGGTFTFKATTKYGTDYNVVYAIGDKANLDTDINVGKTSVVTYSGFQTVDTYTITVPAVAADGNFDIKLEIYSPNGEGKEVISFAKGAKNVDDIITDPEFAKWIENAFGGKEVLTPEDIENVTTIDLKDIGNLTNLDGIKNFPNLTDLNASGTGVTGSLDLSGNPNLEVVNLAKTEISELDLSNNTELKSLQLSYCVNIVELNVSNLGKLEFLHIGGNATQYDMSFEKLILGEANSSLKELYVTDCKKISGFENLGYLTNLEILDLRTNDGIINLILPKLPKLTILALSSNRQLSSLDISECKSIQNLNLAFTNNPVVYVWSGFDIQTPKNTIPTYWAGGSTPDFQVK